MNLLGQIRKEIGFYESRELLPWKVRAGETRAIVSLGLLYHKHGVMDMAEYFLFKATEYDAWNSFVTCGDYLYSKGDKKTAFDFYKAAVVRKEDNAAVKLAYYVYKECPQLLQTDERLRRGLIDGLYNEATLTWKESYHKAMYYLQKMGAKEEIQKAQQIRSGQFGKRCKDQMSRFKLCKAHYAETEKFYPFFPGTWNNRSGKNLAWIFVVILSFLLASWAPLLEIVGVLGTVLFVFDKIRITSQVLWMMIPKFACGIDYNLNKRNPYYHKYVEQVIFRRPKRPSSKAYTEYTGKWEEKPTGLFGTGEPEYEYVTKISSFDGEGYAAALESYKREYTSQVREFAEWRRKNLISLYHENPDPKHRSLVKKVLHDIHGYDINENGEVKSVPMSEFAKVEIQQFLHCEGELEREMQERNEWIDIMKSVKLN